MYLFGCIRPPVPHQDLGCILWEFSMQRMNFPGMARRLSCSTLGGILVPWPGIEPMCPALQSGFLTTGPPRKSLCYIYFNHKKGSWGCCIRILSSVGAELHWTPQSGSQVWLNYCTSSSVCFLCGKNRQTTTSMWKEAKRDILICTLSPLVWKVKYHTVIIMKCN